MAINKWRYSALFCLWSFLMKQLFFLLLFFGKFCSGTQKPFVVLIASYNNEQWCERNLESVFSQEYENYRVIYVDDCSTDSTGQLVDKYVQHSGKPGKVTFVHNAKRMGHLHNQYTAIHTCKDNEIIVILDGDDWFAHNQVFAHLNELYQNSDVWLTYGQFKELSDDTLGYCQQIPDSVINNCTIRLHKPWVFGHARTFYAGLFKRVKKEDLFYNDKFFPMAADVATMIPMAEMAGEHIRFVSEVLYVHNDCNPLNLKKAWQMQAFYETVIRRRALYSPLSVLNF